MSVGDEKNEQYFFRKFKEERSKRNKPMKYKVGDLVRLKEDKELKQSYYNFYGDKGELNYLHDAFKKIMGKSGQVVEITSILYDNYFLDSGYFNVTDEMIECKIDK